MGRYGMEMNVMYFIFPPEITVLAQEFPFKNCSQLHEIP
jgi:hypothetical protein